MKKNCLDDAIKLAVETHFGQTDKGGEIYVLHPLRVMMNMVTEDEKIVAVLHDVVEDSACTLDKLENKGFSTIIIDAVDALTRRSDENYSNFINRVNLNPLARKVKIEDIRDNLDVTRLSSISAKDAERIQKYHQALKQLVDSNSQSNLSNPQKD